MSRQKPKGSRLTLDGEELPLGKMLFMCLASQLQPGHKGDGSRQDLRSTEDVPLSWGGGHDDEDAVAQEERSLRSACVPVRV